MIKYQGKIRQNDFADNLYFYQNYSNTHRYQLTTTKIKGTEYFKIGKNQYVKAANVDAIDGNKLLFSQTTVTVKSKAPQLFRASKNRALTTGKFYKKGQKLVVDQLGGMDVLANSFPNAYHIKGTD
ncbi:MAG: SLAP domain-containing protein [Lactobacillus sp.]|nr:SLAP domain-containing protein [Lactobacillus sp.]